MQTNHKIEYKKIAEEVLTKIQHFIVQSATNQTSKLTSSINTSDVLKVIERFIMITAKQKNLLTLQAPIKVVGDIQGHLIELIRILQYGGQPLSQKYLFLGNYIEAGKHSFFTLLYLYCLKLIYPKNIYLLRGSNQSTEMAKYADFQKECIKLTNRQIFQAFCESFAVLSLAAVISGKIFCVHGGFSPEVSQLSQINEIFRFNSTSTKNNSIRDMLWSDPMQSISGWAYNDSRNMSYYFGPNVVTQFLQRNNLQLVIRSHEYKQSGYEINSLSNLITIFSASNYIDSYQNSGAFISISEQLNCSFFLLKPINKNLKIHKKQINE